MSTTSTASPSLRLGEKRLPIVLPSIRDPRLHTAGVIISVHVLGITALGFRVSVPQILSAIFAAGLVDVLFALRRSSSLVWPASGMLTGSGVALILRETGMQSGDYWSWSGWHYFALIAGASVLTKHVIRYRGAHVFNPSNLGLVVAFLILGSSVIEPLDFWWAPMSVWMALAYLIIIGGGVLITRRLRLLEMVLGFWIVLSAGLGVLAVSGHCMTAAWSPEAVCGGRFWSVLVTSPEVLIFMFFMITDPRTVPTGRSARLMFAASLAVVSTVLIAPQAVEFGAKVALLGSLVIWSPLRNLFDGLIPDGETRRTGLGMLLERLSGPEPKPVSALVRGALIGSVLTLAGIGIVAAGSPAREVERVAPSEPVAAVQVDASALPVVAVDDEVRGLNIEVDAAFAQELAVMLAEDLELEREAIRTGNGSLLASADSGSRLADMQAALDEALAVGERVAHEYRFDSLFLDVAEVGDGQSGAALAFLGSGTMDRIVYDPSGTERSRTSHGFFDTTFVMRQLGGDRWLIVSVSPGE